MVLALAQKKGMWARVWKSVAGEPENEFDEEDAEWVEVQSESRSGIVGPTGNSRR
jgi:protoheme IX farnesyltransferase